MERRREEQLSRQREMEKRLKDLERKRMEEEAERARIREARDAYRHERLMTAERILDERREAIRDELEHKTLMACERKTHNEIESVVRKTALRARKDLRARQNFGREMHRQDVEKSAKERRIREKRERVEALEAQKAAMAHQMSVLRTKLAQEEQILRDRIEKLETLGPQSVSAAGSGKGKARHWPKGQHRNRETQGGHHGGTSRGRAVSAFCVPPVAQSGRQAAARHLLRFVMHRKHLLGSLLSGCLS